ncbi:GAF and ANTAR domain-containing protein [Kineococcus rubinsiae]|uniref:GAF and ANTAR domain-containing protein n=1 Tax=Kineococcus rubinsiae TaxID=2609562 RepID=UPI001AD8F775|nr:GAF and ANTAR domain-containing protein [Kineococcus rubinsiae]
MTGVQSCRHPDLGAMVVSSAAAFPIDGPRHAGLHHVPALVARFERSLAEATDGEDDSELPSLLCQVAKQVLGVDGAAMLLQTATGLRLPLGASDALSATAERLQFTAGEGPCFEAMTTGRPITISETSMRERWPVLAALHGEDTPFTGGMSVPLRAGELRFGVLDLYLVHPGSLTGQDIIAAQLIAQAIADVFLDKLRPDTATPVSGSEVQDVPDGWLDTSAVHQRRDVWVAAGMANLALGLRHEDALALLRASAVSRGQTLDAFAHDIATGDVDLATLEKQPSSGDGTESATDPDWSVERPAPRRTNAPRADTTTPAPAPAPASPPERASAKLENLARITQLEATVEQLQTALSSRPRIEHAVGMIMMLMPCGEELAVAALKRVSMNTNRKLIDVADVITSSASRGKPLPADLMAALHDVLPPRARSTHARPPASAPAATD